MVHYKGTDYTPEQIQNFREWAKDCTWREDEDNSFIDDLTDLDIIKGVERNFAGGLQEAILCTTPQPIN